MKNISRLHSSSECELAQQKLPPTTDSSQPTIALLNSYDLIDDFLDSLNISLETYCDEFIGSWLFGYIDALKQVGVRTVLFCFSMRVDAPSRFLHKPTKTTICVLPPSRLYRIYRSLRRSLLKVYGARDRQAFKDIEDNNRLRRLLLVTFKDLARSLGSYLCMPWTLFAQELRREHCQAILCQEYESARFDCCVLLGRLIGLPTVGVFQGRDQLVSWLEAPLRLLTMHICTGLIIATQTEIERVRARYRLPANKIARIFNPKEVVAWQAVERSEARAALNIPMSAQVVVWHGRVEIERKGLDILLEAWQLLCSERSEQDLRLLLVGTGSDADKLCQQIQTMQLRGVQWLNEFISDRTVILRYLSAADVYAFPSRQEGFPVAPLEAMCCCLPVVAADAPGIPNIFEDGEASGGIVVPRNNAIAFACALDQILDDPSKAVHLGLRARHRIMSSFAPEVIGKQLKKFLIQENFSDSKNITKLQKEY